MKPAFPGERPAASTIPAAIALLMLLVSVFIAMQLSFGLIGASYSHWIIGASPAVNDSSTVMQIANRVASAFPRIISMGIARAIIMVITFAIGAVLLHTTADYRISQIGGHGAAIVLVCLALLVMFFGGVRFAWDVAFSALDFIAHVGLSAMLIFFTTLLVQVLRRPRLLIWFAVPFALLLVVQILFLLIASRALQLDVRFAANLIFLLALGLFAGSLAYTYKMLTHLLRK